MDMIETKNLAFAYPADEGEIQTLALRDVSVSIEKGSFVVVLGHNGSGKSTFAKCLNAVLLPCGGKVYVEGMDTQDEALLLEIRRRVGMVFQNPDNQIVANVVEEDVAFAPENLGVPTEEIRRRVDAALAAVDMTAFTTHAPHLLSGGQKQRVAIAGVIAMEPACIVLDEATAMLDPVGRQEVLSAVHKLNREKGITVVLITHHINEAEDADRVIVMDDGQVVLDGGPREVFTKVEALRSMGLTVPDTIDLLDRLRRDGVAVPPRGAVSQWLRVLLYTVTLIAAIALTLTLMTFGERALWYAVNHFHLPEWMAALWVHLRFPAAGAVSFFALLLLYALAQDTLQPMRNIWPGTLFSLAAWMVVSGLYSYYANHFSHYSLLYGSIGAIIVVLIWLNLTAVTLILGAEVNGVLISMRKDRLTEQ